MYSEKRYVLDFIKGLQDKNGSPRFAGKTVTPSTLRLESEIKNGIQTFKFPIVEDNGASQPTERRLKRNDTFVVTDIKVGLIARLSTKVGTEVIQTYPNPQIFVTQTTEFVCGDLEVIYNGVLNYLIGQTKVIDGLDMSRFRCVDQLIQTSATTASSDHKDLGSDELVPFPILEGTGSSQIEVVLPQVDGLKIANTVANTKNFIVIQLRGFLIPA